MKKLLLTLLTSMLLVMSGWTCDQSSSTLTSVTNNGDGTYDLLFEVCFAGSNASQGDSHGFFITLTGANVISSSPSSFTISSTISATISGNTVSYGPWNDNGSACFVCTTDAQQCINVTLTVDALPTAWEVGGQEFAITPAPNDNDSYCRSTGTISAPMSIDLISFYGEQETNHNVLTWNVEEEVAHYVYILEKSYDGIIWEDIFEVKPNNYSRNQMYNHKDYNLTNSTSYYRLKDIDNMGIENISDIIVVYNFVKEKTLIKSVNYLGQPVDDNYNGIVVEMYNDGSTIQKIRNLVKKD